MTEDQWIWVAIAVGGINMLVITYMELRNKKKK
jgi:hypothetical protein